MAEQKFRRWYEKNKCLRAFINLMEKLDVDEQCELAVDIILKASSMIDRDYKKIIHNVANYNPCDFNRWYDKNPNLHLAIESFRDLDDYQKELIVNELSSRILINKNVEGLDDFE